MSLSVLISWILFLLFDVLIFMCLIGFKATRTFQNTPNKFVYPQTELLDISSNVFECVVMSETQEMTYINIDRCGAQILHEAISVR